MLSVGPGLPAPKLATLTLYPDPGPFTPPPTLDPGLQTTWSTLYAAGPGFWVLPWESEVRASIENWGARGL